jgi:hypothetical protein
LINVHLNGDLVRCPNISEILKKNWEIKDSHHICRYNYHEDQCSSWQSSIKNWQNVKDNACSGRCNLSGSVICPGHIKKTKLGKQEKKFKIDNQIYRKLASSAHYMVKESEFKTIFITLTFPKFKKKVSYNEVNKHFSKFVENLRKRYNCRGYIATREFGEKTHRVHFHLVLNIPFVNFSTLNAAWCHSINDICDYSPNALTSTEETRYIRNPTVALKYICKYISKCRNQRSKTRLVFCSNNIIQKPKGLTDISIEDLLKDLKGIYINRTSDYTTCFRVTNQASFDIFCNRFLYPFFELTDKKNIDFYGMPGSSP